MLHLIFKSPVDLAVLERMASGDAAVFLESAVLSVLENGSLAYTLTVKLATNRFYVLADDMKIRGIFETEIVPGLTIIDYTELVRLTIENPLIQSWC
jgi:tRNA 2-thiouridine synthesizing protein B